MTMDENNSFGGHSGGATTPSSIHVVLLDDDTIFGSIMERTALQYKIRLTFCSTLNDFRQILGWKDDKPNVIIIDCDLGEETGVEMARLLPPGLASCPVLLVSGGKRVHEPISAWPNCIKGFLQKTMGPFAIIEAAVAACDAQENLSKG